MSILKCFCSKCNKATDHRVLKTLNFFQQCAVAAITKFNVGLIEPTHECNNCGHQSIK